MKLIKSKKGISLIVLVITIVVMIILATAIILSLNSSNISEKAGEAKLSSDFANKKEAASVYVSEYEINVAKGKIDASTTTANDYVRAELKKAGMTADDIVVTEDKEILVGVAAMFINNNVEIGTEIKGYILNNTTSYKTSGKENTCGTSNMETDPQPATITRQTESEKTWKYMGINSNGEVLLVGGLTAGSPTMKLGGKGGYLYGPQELNAACEAMYSSSMGIARSINIDDVIRILEYTGERGSYAGAYYDPDTYIVMTITEIAQKIGYNMSSLRSETPDNGKYIGSYYSDYYYINKTEDVDEYNVTAQNLIYPGAIDLKATYWLASSCAKANLYAGYVSFYVRYVGKTAVEGRGMFFSYDEGNCTQYAIRPVVSLKSNVKLKYENSSWVIY